MKLTTITHVSVDGVMQGLGRSDEDRRGGFERGGWAPPLVVGEAATFLNQVFQPFPNTGPDTALDLVDSRATPSGVTVYRPTGRRSMQPTPPTEALRSTTLPRSSMSPS
jgi:hypothetical protein